MALQLSRHIRNRPKTLAFALALLLLMPAAAWADACQPASVCFSNQGGTMTGGNSGLILDGSSGSVLSTLTQINGSNLATDGTLSFTTGSIMGGSLAGLTKAGESVDFNPGTLTITGTYGGFTGTLFSGTFGSSSSPIIWTLISIVGKGKTATYTYNLAGPISGTWYNGALVTGATTQLVFKIHGGPYTGGPIGLETGTSYITTPEPGSLALMGTGLLGVGLTIRQRMRGRRGLTSV